MSHPRWCTQNFDLRGPQNATAGVRPTAIAMPSTGAGRTLARSSQDQGRYPGRLPCLTPCPTVYFLQYSATVPRDSGENDDFHAPHSCAPPLLVTIKGGGGLPLTLSLGGRSDTSGPQLLRSPTFTIIAIPDSSSSRDLGASLPLSPCLYPLLQAHRVQDNTVPSHTPFAGRTTPRPEPR